MPKEKILPTFLFFLIASLILILVNKLGWAKPLISLVETITIPVRIPLYRLSQEAQKISFSGNQKKLDQLENQLHQCLVQTAQLQNLQAENQALRKQLEAPLPASMKFIPAKTLGMSRYLTIDKGEGDGVEIGMIVIAENILVGKIINVTPKTADVLLPTDPESKIPSRTIKTNSLGLLTGEFGTKAYLDKVLQAETLEQDDLVVTLGEGGFTKDLLIGTIEKIEKQEVQPFQKAEIKLLLNYTKLENVFIIK